MKSKDKPKPDKNKHQRGRPVEKPYPERIEASPEEIAEMVLRMPNKSAMNGATSRDEPQG